MSTTQIDYVGVITAVLFGSIIVVIWKLFQSRNEVVVLTMLSMNDAQAVCLHTTDLIIQKPLCETTPVQQNGNIL